MRFATLRRSKGPFWHEMGFFAVSYLVTLSLCMITKMLLPQNINRKMMIIMDKQHQIGGEYVFILQSEQWR